MSEPLCATCGHPRDNHPYRHPFAGPSKDDTIKELEAKLAKAVEALRFVVSAKGLTDPTEYGYEAIKQARTALAEIEGEKT
jgi:hypothetical protein